MMQSRTPPKDQRRRLRLIALQCMKDTKRDTRQAQKLFMERTAGQGIKHARPFIIRWWEGITSEGTVQDKQRTGRPVKADLLVIQHIVALTKRDWYDKDVQVYMKFRGTEVCRYP